MAIRRILAAASMLALIGLSACGKPEDDGANADALTTPLPPYPAWAKPMIGQPLTKVLNGRGDCEGVFDVVISRHAGAHPGVEVGGWAWDKAGQRGVQHILFVDPDNKVIGAAEGGLLRTDVPKAMPEVKSPMVGWRGEIGATTGVALAVGIGANNGACLRMGKFQLSTGY
jgi:hypothetical protein